MADLTGLWIPVEILTDTDLTSTEKLVVAEIYFLQPCVASNEHIGNILNLNKRQVMRIIKKLEEKGWIKTIYLSPVKREITSTKNVTSDKIGTSDKMSPTTKNVTTKNVTIYQKCHHTSAKIGTELVTKLVPNSTKNVTLDNRDNIENIVENNTRAREEATTTIPENVLMTYQDNIQVITRPYELERLTDDVEHYGADTVIKAIHRAVLRNKRSLGYIEGILKDWETNGFDNESTQQKSSPQKIHYL